MNETVNVIVQPENREINIQLSEVSKIYDMGEVQVSALSEVTLKIPKGQLAIKTCIQFSIERKALKGT